MKIIKNKIFATLIALFLMFTLTGTTFFMMPAHAATVTLPPETSAPTYAYLTASPDPIGVGQQIYLTMWLIEFDPLSTSNELLVWQNYNVTVVAPDGTVTTP